MTTPFDALVGGVGWLVRNGESYIVESLSPTGDNEDVTGLGLGSGSASRQGLGSGSASRQGLPAITAVEDDDRDLLVDRLSATLMAHTVIGHDKVLILLLLLLLLLLSTITTTTTTTIYYYYFEVLLLLLLLLLLSTTRQHQDLLHVSDLLPRLRLYEV